MYCQSSSEFMLGLASSISWLESEHMTALIIRLRTGLSVLSGSHKNDVVVLSTPSCASRIPGKKQNVLQVLAPWTEHHHAVGVKHGDP